MSPRQYHNKKWKLVNVILVQFLNTNFFPPGFPVRSAENRGRRGDLCDLLCSRQSVRPALAGAVSSFSTDDKRTPTAIGMDSTVFGACHKG
jgi:hypothetical protein